MTILASKTGISEGCDGLCMCAQGLMTPLSRGEPAHYISTLPFLGRDSQDASPFLKKDVERFLWNFLASRTAAGPSTTGSCGEAVSALTGAGDIK